MRVIDANDFAQRMYHEAFEKDSEDQRWDSGCWIRYKLFERVLKEQPIVEPERNTGKWYDVGALSCRCSECGCKSQKEFKFCPNCGSDMRTEK